MGFGFLSPNVPAASAVEKLRRRALGLGRGIVGAAVLAAFATNAAAVTYQANGFTGIRPPDPSCAAGPQNVITTVSSTMEVYDKLGNRQHQIGLTPFFSTLGMNGMTEWGYLFSPRVVYDQYIGRFIVCVLATETATDRSTSWVLIALSKTAILTEAADINTQFDKFFIETSTNDHWSAQMAIGVDETTLHLSYRMLPKQSGNPNTREHIVNIGAAAGNPPPTLENQFFNNIQDTVVDGPSGLMQPVHSYGSTFGEFLVSFPVVTGELSHLSIYNRDGYGGSTNLLRTWTVNVPAFTPSISARQQGTSVTLASAADRLSNAVWRDNSIWVAHSIQGAGGAAIRWYEIDTSAFQPPSLNGSPVLAQSGEIVLGPSGQVGTFDNIVPAIMVTAAGNMLTSFTSSGPTAFPTFVYATRGPNDAPGVTNPSVIVVPGPAAYEGTGLAIESWGSYAGISLDPLDESTIWMQNEVPTVSSAQWATWVGSVTLAPPGGGGGGGAPPLPAPTSLTLMRPVTNLNFVTQSQELIEWDFTGDGSAPVKISLYRNGAFLGEMARDIPAAAREFNWTVGQLLNGAPVPSGENYQVRVSSQNNPAIFDQGDLLFTITVRVQVTNGVVNQNNQTVDNLIFASGQSLQLVSNVVQGRTPYFYVWTPQDFLDNPNIPNPIATPTQSMVYTLTVLDATGTEASDSVTLTMGTPLMIDAGPDKLFSPGGTVLLEGLVTGGKPPYTIRWRDCNPASPACTTPVVATVIQPLINPEEESTLYYLRVTDADGTIRTDSVLVEVGYTINLENQPANGGTINRTPLEPLYRSGESVTFAAAPASGYSFDHWEGGVSGTANPLVVAFPSQNLSIRAVYTQNDTDGGASGDGDGGSGNLLPGLCPASASATMGIALALMFMKALRVRRRR